MTEISSIYSMRQYVLYLRELEMSCGNSHQITTTKLWEGKTSKELWGDEWSWTAIENWSFTLIFFISRTSGTFQVPWMNSKLADISALYKHRVKESTLLPCLCHCLMLFHKNINYSSHHPCGAYSPQYNKFLKLSTVFQKCPVDFVLFVFGDSTTMLKSAWVPEDPASQRRAGSLSLKVCYSSAFFAGDILYLRVPGKKSEDVLNYFFFPVLHVQSLGFCKRSLPTWVGWLSGDRICIKEWLVRQLRYKREGRLAKTLLLRQVR